ncbi:hypothetical protein [Kitasatospora sp. HPMI-4]|uniref:hypothetical protein n=1 Tax=Kitasatospora sp. HPMI-4 TaxID=3448443 RepID=UPI003F1CA1F3
MRRLLLAVAIVTAVSAAAAPAASAAPKPEHGRHASLRGWARLEPNSTVPSKTEMLTLKVDAHAGNRPGVDPAPATGHATIQHVFLNADGSWQGTVRAEVSVDCLVTGGPSSVVTGVVDSLSFTVPPGQPELPQPASTWHPETAFSFYTDGNGHNRVGWAIPKYDDPTAPPAATRCVTPAARDSDFYVVNGGFTSRS